MATTRGVLLALAEPSEIYSLNVPYLVVNPLLHSRQIWRLRSSLSTDSASEVDDDAAEPLPSGVRGEASRLVLLRLTGVTGSPEGIFFPAPGVFGVVGVGGLWETVV